VNNKRDRGHIPADDPPKSHLWKLFDHRVSACGMSFARPFPASRPWPILSDAPNLGAVPNEEAEMKILKFASIAVLMFAGAALADDQKNDREAFQGTWTIVDRKKADTKEPVTAPTVVFEGDTYQIKAGDKVIEKGTFKVDGSKAPKQIEVTATEGMDKGHKWHGIYEFKGDTMRAVVGPTDKDRPAKYDDPTEGVRAFVLKREKKG